MNNTNGNATNWDPKPNGSISTLSVNGTSLFLGGAYQYLKFENRNSLMAIAKANGLITNWNPNPDGPINTIKLNGTNAYVGGSYTNIGGQPRNYIAEISLSTGNATTWNPNSNNLVNTIEIIGTTVYAGGNFTTIGGQSRNYLAALNNTNGNATNWNPKPDNVVYNIRQADTDIVVIGAFTFMNSEQRSNLMAISKSTGLIKAWSPNPNSTVEAIEINGTNAYIGGSFTTVGGQPRNYIAEINLNTGNATTWNPDANNSVFSIKRFSNTVYAGGAFTTIGGQNRNYLAGLNNSNGNASAWNPDANSNVRKLGVSDSVLYVAGDYTTINGQTRNRLSSFNLPNGNITAWNPDVSGSVNDMQVTGSNIYISGSFNQVSGQSRANLASFAKATGNLKSWNPGLNGTVSSIISKGKLIFCGGSFNVASGQSCNGFAVINANSGVPDLFFPNVTGQINTLSAFDSLIYLGGSFSAINDIAYGGLASISYPNAFFKPEIEDFNPKVGGNVGEVTVLIHGNGFEDGTVVKLKRSGQADVTLQNLFVSDGIQITGIFDLTGVSLGDWDLEIQIPNDTIMTIVNGFTVEQGLTPNVWTEIVGFNVIRIGQWQSYNLVYGNEGNIDAHGVPIWFTVSDNADLELSFQVQKNYEYFDIAYNELYDSIPPYFVTDTVLDVIGSVKLVGLYMPTIQANSTNSLTFKVKVNNAGTINLTSWADEPYFGSPLRGFVNPCYDKLFDLAVGFIPPANCINNAFNAGYQAGTFINDAINGNVASGLGGLAFQMPAVVASGAIDCALGFANLSNIGKVVKLLNKSVFNRGSGAPGLSTIPECLPPRNPPQQIPPIQTINSFDPNDKLGPIGVGSGNFINVSNRTLPYIIRCENADTASAAAQNVVIVDTLDQNVFDLSTFQLGFFSIADSIISVPSGLKNYETDVDLRPDNNIIARVRGSLNMETGVARWEFTSLDPSTLEPTLNPVAGFLPPNINKPEGEGAVMYTIKTLSNVADGAQIKNKAYIYFDLNPAIITNEWSNTSDIIKPISVMAALPPVQYNDSTITLTWSGSDVGSGVQNYKLYYSVNGGQFNLLASYLMDTTITFTGNMDSTYAFFTIATDSVGNIENMKTVAEATTSFALGLNDNLTIDKMIVSIYPNPNQGNFNLSVISQTKGRFDLTIVDVFGRVIYNQKQNLSQGNNILPLILEQTGMYFLTIGNEKERIVRRIVVNK